MAMLIVDSGTDKRLHVYVMLVSVRAKVEISALFNLVCVAGTVDQKHHRIISCLLSTKK